MPSSKLVAVHESDRLDYGVNLNRQELADEAASLAVQGVYRVDQEISARIRARRQRAEDFSVNA